METGTQELPTTGPTTQEAPGLSTSQRLWNAAYDGLREDRETEELVKSYAKTVIQALQARPEDIAVSAEDLNDPGKRQILLEKLVKEGREKVARASKITEESR